MGLMFPIYFLSLVSSAGLTLLSAYQILELSDLDCNHIDPQRCCANLNKVVVPELLCVALIIILNTVTLNPIPVLATAPMFFWLIYNYLSTPRGYKRLFEATEIADHRVLNQHVRKCLFKIGFHFISFLCYMYAAILSIVTT